jgi:hypothetical protein
MTRWSALVACALRWHSWRHGQAKPAPPAVRECIAPVTLEAGQTTRMCRVGHKCFYDWPLRRGACTSRCF